jgi:polyhydroxyalkanoate synthesis regulator phasin
MENYVKQIIDFQKSTFDKTYNAIVQIQDQAEKLAHDVINQMPWIPEEGKKVFDDSVKMFKSAREDYQKMVSEGFVKMKGKILLSKEE